MKIQIEFKNYKHLKDFSAEMQSGNVYFVKGGNNQGKTSFLQGLLSTITGQNKNKQALSFGEQEGSITTKVVDFKGADGENYTIKFNFAEEKADKFTIVKPDTSISKKNSDINAIFKYNNFTVDEFFAWGLTAEGRRKQAQIILSMLTEDVQKEIADIESKINTRNGIIFEDRKKANAIYENKKIEYDNLVLTANEEKMLALPEWIAETNKMLADKENALKLKANNSDVFVNIERLTNEISSLQANRERSDNDYNLFVDNTTKEIERLKNELIVRKEQNEKEISSYVADYELKSQLLDEEKQKIENKNGSGAPTQSIEEIEAALLQRKPYMDIYDSAIRKKESKDAMKISLQEAFEKTQKLTDILEELRKRKINLIASANLPVDNIAIDGDEIIYVTETGESIPFNEENLSYSKGGLIVAQIMLAVNKELPLILVGKSAEYDNKALQELLSIAKDNNALLIMDRVIPDGNTLEIECYETSTTSPTEKPIAKQENPKSTTPFDI